MEVANRLKGLDLTDRVPEDLSIEVCNIVQDFPGGSDGKVSAFCLQCGRPRFNLWVRKISWRRNGCPLQYSCLENSGQRHLEGYSPWGHKESDMTELHTHTHTHNTKKDHNDIAGSVVPGRNKDNRNTLKTW